LWKGFSAAGGMLLILLGSCFTAELPDVTFLLTVVGRAPAYNLVQNTGAL
jgi:hypothetical protein